ncbi:MAG: RluA family pseudouridine synthase [Phycisphaeraceae bacterium]
MDHLRLHSDDAGARLDRVLARRLGLSRRAVWQLLDEGRVQLNGRTVSQRDKGRMLAGDDVLAVTPFVAPDARRAIANPQLPLAVMAVDEAAGGWLIADKPAGMPVHPLRPGETQTLLNAIIARHPAIHGVGEAGLRSGVVHRLDVDTSGLVLFALTQPLWHRLRQAFTDHAIAKQYLALVQGHPPAVGRETMHLAVTQHRPARVRVVEPHHHQSRPCSLAWQVRERFAGTALVEVELHTGFLHQIRAMFAHLGHPVVGDRVYSQTSPVRNEPSRPPVPRLMLHAHRLALDAHLHAESPPPPDFQQVLQRTRTASHGRSQDPRDRA